MRILNKFMEMNLLKKYNKNKSIFFQTSDFVAEDFIQNFMVGHFMEAHRVLVYRFDLFLESEFYLRGCEARSILANELIHQKNEHRAWTLGPFAQA